MVSNPEKVIENIFVRDYGKGGKGVNVRIWVFDCVLLGMNV